MNNQSPSLGTNAIVLQPVFRGLLVLCCLNWSLPRLMHRLRLGKLPRALQDFFTRPIEAHHIVPALARPCLHPVAFLARQCPGAEVNIHRAVRVLLRVLAGLEERLSHGINADDRHAPDGGLHRAAIEGALNQIG